MVEAMERETGFQQTEVGVIPSDWRISTIGDEFDIKLGKMLDAERNVGVLKPYLGNRHIQWNRIETTNIPMMRIPSSELDRFRLRFGDLLVCEGGDVGRAAIWEEQLEECYFQKALHRLRSKRGYNTRIMLELLHYWSTHNKLSDYVTQTSIAHLTREKFLTVYLPVPPKAEQTAIATALSDMDGLINGIEKLLAKKRSIKQGAMQELLRPKEGWVVKKLGEIAITVASGKSNTKSVGGVYSIYGSTGVIGSSKTYDYKGERILVARVGANAGAVNIVDGRYCVSDNTLMLTFMENIDLKFLFYFLIKYNLNKLVFGSGQPLVTGHQLKNIEVILPFSKKEQTHIAQVLSDMDTEIEALEKKLQKYRLLKQGMMQTLLTGKIRLI